MAWVLLNYLTWFFRLELLRPEERQQRLDRILAFVKSFERFIICYNYLLYE